MLRWRQSMQRNKKDSARRWNFGDPKQIFEMEHLWLCVKTYAHWGPLCEHFQKEKSLWDIRLTNFWHLVLTPVRVPWIGWGWFQKCPYVSITQPSWLEFCQWNRTTSLVAAPLALILLCNLWDSKFRNADYKNLSPSSFHVVLHTKATVSHMFCMHKTCTLTYSRFWLSKNTNRAGNTELATPDVCFAMSKQEAMGRAEESKSHSYMERESFPRRFCRTILTDSAAGDSSFLCHWSQADGSWC